MIAFCMYRVNYKHLASLAIFTVIGLPMCLFFPNVFLAYVKIEAMGVSAVYFYVSQGPCL